MPVVCEADVRAGLLARWAAAPALAALVPPARVYADRVAEKAAWPAAAVEVREGPVTRLGGGVYLRTFDATVVALCRQDAGDDAAVRAALTAAFNGTPAAPAAGVAVGGATVLSCLETPGGSRTEAERLDGADLLRLTAAFQITLWGTQ